MPTTINAMCPRCTKRSVRRNVTDKNNAYALAIMGAISRADNKTEICSACGFDEAMLDYDGTGHQPVSAWPVDPKYLDEYEEMIVAIPRDA